MTNHLAGAPFARLWRALRLLVAHLMQDSGSLSTVSRSSAAYSDTFKHPLKTWSGILNVSPPDPSAYCGVWVEGEIVRLPTYFRFSHGNV
jgi:hypothetical protein